MQKAKPCSTAGDTTESDWGTALKDAVRAGKFYPEDGDALRESLSQMIGAAGRFQPRGNVVALLVPHAAYGFSGRTAAAGFAHVARDAFTRAMVIGPCHHEELAGVGIAPYRGYQTPLGVVRIDDAAREELCCRDTYFSARERPHRREHAIEVLLPFIKYRLPEATVVPMLCGRKLADGDIQTLARMLSEYWTPQTLLIVSSDLTHYGGRFGYEPFPPARAPSELPRLDSKALELITGQDLEGFLEFCRSTGISICGWGPIAIMLAMLKLATRAVRLEEVAYTNSGALRGDYRHSVSYASVWRLSRPS